MTFGGFTRQSGDALNGIYVAQMLVPEASEPGIWKFEVLNRLELADFVVCGWPVHFTNAPALALAKSGPLLGL